MKKILFSENEIKTRIGFKSDLLPPQRQDAPNAYGEFICNFTGVPENKEFCRIVSIRPGLAMTFFHLRSTINLEVDFEVENAPVSFCYCLSGNNIHRFRRSGSQEMEYRTKAGANVVSCLAKISGDVKMLSGIDQAGVSIQVDPKLLLSYIENDVDRLPADFKCLFKNKNVKSLFIPGRMTPAMESAVFQIVNCPFSGACRQLFYESKATELLCLQIDEILKCSAGTEIKLPDKSDTEKIYEARDILIRNLANPPRLTELSRMAGINEFKLKSGFRQIFGTTVFGYLHNYKMEKAKYFIEDGGMNVSETAWSIGYTNVSHFIAAYRKRYGINPGRLLKEKRTAGICA